MKYLTSKTLSMIMLLGLLTGFSPGLINPVWSFGQEIVSGRVTDVHNKPVKFVKVELWEKDGELYQTTSTNRRGEFKIKHDPCGPCFLEVVAPLKSRLAQALVEDIPGNDDRSVLVTLKRGFLIRGKVLHQGKPLRDLVIKVYSEDHATDDSARTYGGGAARTGLMGGFEMVLTPGEKRIVVLNNRYPELSPRYEAKLKVIEDAQLADIEIPEK
ncbi:hypothetical protein GC174_08005 [bacterium]|nr:hypothetical protein [bacterium]